MMMMMMSIHDMVIQMNYNNFPYFLINTIKESDSTGLCSGVS